MLHSVSGCSAEWIYIIVISNISRQKRRFKIEFHVLNIGTKGCAYISLVSSKIVHPLTLMRSVKVSAEWVIVVVVAAAKECDAPSTRIFIEGVPSGLTRTLLSYNIYKTISKNVNL